MYKMSLALGIIGVASMIGFYFNPVKPTQYTATPQVEAPKQVIQQEDVLQSRIKQAQEAKKNDIEVEAQKAKDASIKQANLEIELEVTTAFRKEIEAKEKELQKQSIAY